VRRATASTLGCAWVGGAGWPAGCWPGGRRWRWWPSGGGRFGRRGRRRGGRWGARRWPPAAGPATWRTLTRGGLAGGGGWVWARARWQIELLFKRWKSHGGLEASRGKRAERVLCEVYAKLIGQVVQQWLLVTCGGPCVAYSYPKAARRVRRQAAVLARLLP